MSDLGSPMHEVAVMVPSQGSIYPKARLGLEDLLLEWLPHIGGKSRLAVGGGPPLLAPWTS